MACALSENPPFLFIHIPKTGGSSLFSTRSGATRKISAQCKNFQLMSGHHTLKTLSKRHDISKYLIFSIVRNPYDRLASMWLVRKGKVNLSLNGYIRELRTDPYRWSQARPQYKWIELDNNHHNITILKFERYSEDISSLFTNLGIELGKLPHLRKTHGKKDYHQHLITQKHWVSATNLYQKDFELFNYPTENV